MRCGGVAVESDDGVVLHDEVVVLERGKLRRQLRRHLVHHGRRTVHCKTSHVALEMGKTCHALHMHGSGK